MRTSKELLIEAKTPSNQATPANISILGSIFDDKEEVPNGGFKPVDIPHLRRCQRAGLIQAVGGMLRLTDAGKTALKALREPGARPVRLQTTRGQPTEVNLFAMCDLFGDRDEVSNRVSPTDMPHIRRCIDAGLIEPGGGVLRLTAAGKTAVKEYRARNPKYQREAAEKESAEDKARKLKSSKWQVLGITDERDQCEVCGKPNLKRVVVLSDGMGEIYVGTECASIMTSTRPERVWQKAVQAQSTIDHEAADREWSSILNAKHYQYLKGAIHNRAPDREQKAKFGFDRVVQQTGLSAETVLRHLSKRWTEDAIAFLRG